MRPSDGLPGLSFTGVSHAGRDCGVCDTLQVPIGDIYDLKRLDDTESRNKVDWDDNGY